MQNVLQNIQLQKFIAKVLQIDLEFGHEVPIFWLMLFSRRGSRMRDWQPLLLFFFCTFWKINSAHFLQKLLHIFFKHFAKNVQKIFPLLKFAH